MAVPEKDSRTIPPGKTVQLPRVDVSFLGRKLTCMTVQSAVDAVLNACVHSDKILVSHYNVHSFNLSMQIPWLFNFQSQADLVLCDSMGILYALRYSGLKLPRDYRVSYSLLIPQLLEMCNQRHLSVFLLGGSASTSTLALERVQSAYPNITLDGHHGYFPVEDEGLNAALVQKINLFRPHILIVGMGVPRQEQWLSLYHQRLNVNVCMNGGAVIDRLAGVVEDCPNWLSNVGFEWLYRFMREPKRLFSRYIIGNIAFSLQLLLSRSDANPEASLRILSPSELSIVSSRITAYENPIPIARAG